MTTFTSVQAGSWSSFDTWDVGADAPSSGDDVIILHNVTLSDNANCLSCEIQAGGLVANPTKTLVISDGETAAPLELSGGCTIGGFTLADSDINVTAVAYETIHINELTNQSAITLNWTGNNAQIVSVGSWATVNASPDLDEELSTWTGGTIFELNIDASSEVSFVNCAVGDCEILQGATVYFEDCSVDSLFADSISDRTIHSVGGNTFADINIATTHLLGIIKWKDTTVAIGSAVYIGDANSKISVWDTTVTGQGWVSAGNWYIYGDLVLPDTAYLTGVANYHLRGGSITQNVGSGNIVIDATGFNAHNSYRGMIL